VPAIQARVSTGSLSGPAVQSRPMERNEAAAWLEAYRRAWDRADPRLS
jgi:hypothetical protein